MLAKLRKKLTVLCSIVTGAVLIAMAFLALGISENQLAKAHTAAFKSNITTVVYRLQIDKGISTSWLAQTEATERLIIHVEDDGKPLLFDGSWETLTARQKLVEEAKAKAAKLGIDSTTAPASLLETPQAIFEQRGEHGERYLSSVTMILTQSGWQGVTMLRDMRVVDSSALTQRWIFTGIVFCGIILLFLCGWLVAGRAIKPIEHNMKQQVEFVAAASHELRSPLAVIQASADAITAEPLQAQRFASNIEHECVRMGRLIEDLLLLAGGDAKTWSIKVQPIETDTLLIDTVEMFLPVAGKREQQISLDLPDEALPCISGDFSRLQQALSVLIDNAAFYSGEKSKIAISAIAEGRTLRISVTDNGKGVPIECAPHIFDRFYRADKARSDKNHFGLGLSIAQELIKLHHGKLYLDSGYKNGCSFVIELPIAAANQHKGE